VATSTSQTCPGFSVTRASVEPGRNAIAHGESKAAITEVLNGCDGLAESDGSPLFLAGAEPQAETPRSSAMASHRILDESPPRK
jgi:hypothetical protein